MSAGIQGEDQVICNPCLSSGDFERYSEPHDVMPRRLRQGETRSHIVFLVVGLVYTNVWAEQTDPMMPCHNPAQKPAGVAFGSLYFELGPAIVSILAMRFLTITATRGVTNILWKCSWGSLVEGDLPAVVAVYPDGASLRARDGLAGWVVASRPVGDEDDVFDEGTGGEVAEDRRWAGLLVLQGFDDGGFVEGAA